LRLKGFMESAAKVMAEVKREQNASTFETKKLVA
jgi:hypothetical protein